MLKTATNIIDASQIKTPITLPGNVTLSTGNLVIGTAGKGIDFSATSGTGTSELLADYEEGTWTPIDGSGAGLIFTATGGFYTKVGRQVFWQCTLAYPSTVDATNARVGGLPFTAVSGPSTEGRSGATVSYTNKGSLVNLFQIGTAIFLYKVNGVAMTNSELSTGTVYLAGSFIV